MTPEQAENRIRTALDFQMKGHEKYYEWVRQMLVISTGSLAILVGMQSNFVPENPKCLWMLQLCWILLALVIAAGAIVLHGEHDLLHRLSQEFLKQVSEAKDRLPDTNGGMVTVAPSQAAKGAEIAFPWLLAGSLAMLAVFASLNTGHSPSKQRDGRHNTQHKEILRVRPNPS
jgi:hypothetical protein